MRPRTRAWRGDWLVLIVTSVGTDARTGAALRTTMHDKRFGELREGVWMRPDNLELELGPDVTARGRLLTARDAAPAPVAGELRGPPHRTFPVGAWCPRRGCAPGSPPRCCPPNCCPPIGPAAGCGPPTATSP